MVRHDRIQKYMRIIPQTQTPLTLNPFHFELQGSLEYGYAPGPGPGQAAAGVFAAAACKSGVQGQVTLNGAVCHHQAKGVGSELSCCAASDPADQPYLAEDIPLDIVYEDESILIINKPVGWSCIPAAATGRHFAQPPCCTMRRIWPRCRAPALCIGWTRTPAPAGRGKTIIAQTDLVRQLQARTVSREYLALVHGEVARAAGWMRR